MKRRSFGVLAGTTLAALKFGYASAQATRDAALLKTTLTPMGGERAGNADGSIPAWTGGFTTLPAGWRQGDTMPDFFAGEQPVVVVDASNMAQYADRLSEGTMALMQKYGFSIKVYPTHRTAAAPQWVYDNIAQNAVSAQLDPAGPQLGFSGAYGGIPFPMPDVSNPLSAGAEIIWNHENRWQGGAYTANTSGYVVNNGEVVLSDKAAIWYDYPYYRQNGTLATYKGVGIRQFNTYLGPPALVGQEINAWTSTDPYKNPNQTWELLNGQGRVRRAPEVEFDTPSSAADGVINYDEYFGFDFSMEQYDWKYIGKKELYIPYNNNGLYLLPAVPVHLAHFLDPNVVRWELHRVWVVEATLHPGKRNVMARRRFYVDEDTFIIGNVDTYDANNALYHVGQVFNYVRPDLPGTIYGNNVVYNMQTGDYATVDGIWNEAARPTFKTYASLPDSTFDPENMAASGQF